MKVQWYPGHMAKSSRELEAMMSKVDVVAELADARIPISGRNPALARVLKDKPRIIVLNREDLAASAETARWLEKFRQDGFEAFSCCSKTGAGCDKLRAAVRRVAAEKLERRAARGIDALSLKVAVVGIPNVGKSSFINRVAGKKPAKTEDRPGVTRKNQWYNLDSGIDLLDTPGLLAPRLEPEEAGEDLAFTGAVPDAILDTESLAALLLERLERIAPASVMAACRRETDEPLPGHELLALFCRRRGFLQRGGEEDTERGAHILLDEYREGKLGRITLEPVSFVYRRSGN